MYQFAESFIIVGRSRIAMTCIIISPLKTGIDRDDGNGIKIVE
jgi:hypothetical protein